MNWTGSRSVGRNIGQVVKHSRNIGSIANQMSGGRLSQSPIAQKIQDVANKIESGANFDSGNEDRGQICHKMHYQQYLENLTHNILK